MSVQIFLQGKLQGTEAFLRAAQGDLAGRAQWATLAGEVVPRALLAELRLSPLLLGASGGGQFLMVLPQETRERAEQFLRDTSAALEARTGYLVSLAWAFTEDLGDWSDIRKRLLTGLHVHSASPAAAASAGYFAPVSAAALPPFELEFREGSEVCWSAASAGELLSQPAEGAHCWKVGDDIPLARHAAPDEDGTAAAGPATLARRAEGRKIWGILRGEVDDFEKRLRRVQTAEEHLQLSRMYSQFFQGELQMRCSLPEFWRKVTLLRADGPEFAVMGSWDALLALARETWRLFGLFAETNLRDYAGTEGKTMSYGFALAESVDASPESVYAEAGNRLRVAQAAGLDSISVLGRILDARQFADASESRVNMARLVREFGAPAELLEELAAFYRDGSDTIVAPGMRRTNTRLERPWRFRRRLDALLGSSTRNKEYARLRAELIADFTGRRASSVRLRPHGRVALEWARLETERA